MWKLNLNAVEQASTNPSMILYESWDSHLQLCRAFRGKSCEICCTKETPPRPPHYTHPRRSTPIANLQTITQKTRSTYQTQKNLIRRRIKSKWVSRRCIRRNRERTPLATYWISPAGELRRNHLAISFFCSSLISTSPHSPSSAIAVPVSTRQISRCCSAIPLFSRCFSATYLRSRSLTLSRSLLPSPPLEDWFQSRAREGEARECVMMMIREWGPLGVIEMILIGGNSVTQVVKILDDQRRLFFRTEGS